MRLCHVVDRFKWNQEPLPDACWGVEGSGVTWLWGQEAGIKWVHLA